MAQSEPQSVNTPPTDSIPGSKSFPFFHLPPEIRNQIYSCWFVSQNAEHLIIPDYMKSRRRNHSEQYPARMTRSLPFLQTCRQAHREATTILYGSNVFYFNDETHGFEEYVEEYGFKIPLLSCDLSTIYPFLIRIGYRNRLKIKHLRLGFSRDVYLYYQHELDKHWLNFGKRGGANHVGDALELLTKGHNLQMFEIELDGDVEDDSGDEFYTDDPSYQVPHVYCELFRCAKTLLRRLRQLRGIKELRVFTPTGFDLTAHDRLNPGVTLDPMYPELLELKAEMESEDLERKVELER